MIGQIISHYRILEKLGAGGMGVVYKAEDTRLHRFVALKFLPPEVAREPQALARFRREAQAASALNHPNVCTIYDIGEHDGKLFIVMELLEGETLANCIGGKPLPLEYVLGWGANIVDALAAAHGRGIIHRDMKPGNIFINSDHRVKILDFGLAKLLSQETIATGDFSAERNLTAAGVPLGTFAYMSPEQARGAELDVRTDLFSFGATLYEMATGVGAFRGKTIAETFQAILAGQPLPITVLNPGMPARLQEITAKCLEKDPTGRYQTAVEISTDLQDLARGPDRPAAVGRPRSKPHNAGRSFPATPPVTASDQAITEPKPSQSPPVPGGGSLRHKPRLALIAVALPLLIVAVGSYFVMPFLGPRKPVMLAVLPFQNLSGDPEQEYFTDGLTEEAITDLGQISPKKLGVIARTSAMTYKGSNKTARQIGQELGVDYILEGSARREGEIIRVSAQLIRVRDQSHVWAQSFDREMHKVLSVQNDLGQAIAQRVQVSLAPRELAQSRRRPVDPEAYDLYLRGRYFWNKTTPDGFAKAIAYFQQAVERDPTYAPAYVGLADCYGSLPIAGDAAPNSSFPLAQAATKRALELDDSLAEAYASQVRINLWYEWNWQELEHEAHQALVLNPNSAEAHFRYAHYLSNAKRHKEALEEVQQAKKLDPLSPLINTVNGQFMYYAGQNDLAIKQLRETVELFPDFWVGHINLGKVFEQKQMYLEAIKEFEKARDLGGTTETLSLAGHAYAVSGNRRQALRMLEDLKEQARQRYVPPYNIALIYAGLGDKNQALDWLEKGFEVRDAHMVFLSVDPKWDGLRGERRFQEVVSRIGLETPH